jgi:phospholipase/carboxylesterase
MQYLPAVTIEPESAARASVIWLHGLGADGHDFEPIVPYLGLDAGAAVRFVFPHAPRRGVSINMGLIMPAWYDIRSLERGGDLDEPGIADSAEKVRALISREGERGVPPERVVLAGFSQGGAIALHVGLRHTPPLAGILALSTYLLEGETLQSEMAEASKSVPIFQAHGSADPMVAIEYGEASCRRLVELGCQVEWHVYPMAHEVSPEEIRDIGRGLNARLAPGEP